MTEHRAIATSRATYQDVLDAPEHMIAEILNGQLHLQPRPRSRHALACSALGSEIGGPFHFRPDGPGGWWILYEPEIHLGDDVLVPDLAGWRRETLPELPDVAFLEQTPDWVCEVLSPSTSGRDRGEKRDLYRHHGVSFLWLVDPEARVLEAFELTGESWVLRLAASGDDEVAVPPFDAIKLDLSSLWLPVPSDDGEPLPG